MEFARKISNVQNANSYYMVSLDVENLFTNVPLEETINICLDKLFFQCNSFAGFTRNLFKNLLELALLNTFFIFDGKYFSQTEGVGMGLPLGPSFANIFLCHHEESWISNCPSDFKPAQYYRYVDDTFLLFRNKEHATQFLDYCNDQHPSIHFTMETEFDNKLPFLDVNVYRHNDRFYTSVFRKPSFSGLTLSYFSFCCRKFKMNSIYTLVNRAINICSNHSDLYQEFDFITKLFFLNGYPKNLIRSIINKVQSKNNITTPDLSTDVPKKTVYYVLPYFGHKSVVFKSNLMRIVSKYFSAIDVKFVFTNDFTLEKIFNFKDSIPKELRSRVVYNFSCAHPGCASAYVGSTVRNLITRVSEHRGISVRTGTPFLNPPHSSVRSHCLESDHPLSFDQFKIVASSQNFVYLRILESLHILKNKPNLNDMQSAHPLSIVYK